MKKIIIAFLFPFVVCGQHAIDLTLNFIKDKEYSQAEKTIQSYVDSHADDLEAVELLGDIYGHQEKWDDAIKVYQQLVEHNPNSANYQYKYGGVMAMKAKSILKIRAVGLIGDAKAAFLKAAELDPNHIDVRWALVELYMQLPGIVGGSMSKSLHFADELETISQVDGYLAKGYIYDYDDEPELAETYYKKAIKVGGSLTCFDKLTSFYEKENKPQKAINNLEATKEKYNRNALDYRIGKVAARYNIELEKGEICLNRYIEHYSPTDEFPPSWAHYRLAQIYIHKKIKSKALEYIDLALSENPEMKSFQETKAKILNM
ncbi:tetratricopeptide repeat protein [Gaetbulibacter saemankumensis]|uniref:tetratricopeptide repeat protein n=1 Tax=Gaetbulibacter saemankumensis TaxID=311208 RepID=UPI0004883162|nr:tetratricopeptide repeat protein [Gaetbulibacter saemankumensis]